MRYHINVIILLLFLLTYCDRGISTTQPDPEPGTGKIVVMSNPPGYDIYLENKISGYQTPFTYTYMDRGLYNISLKSYYMLDTVGSSFIPNGGIDTLFFDMEEDYRFYGAIDIDSSPFGAEIIINDESTGQYTPKKVWNIYPGLVNITLRKPGYRDAEGSVFLKSLDELEFSTTLDDTTIWALYQTENSGIPTNLISCIGDETCYWFIGSSDKGVMLVDPPKYSYFNNSNSGLNAKHINDLSRFGPKGDYLLYAATNNGLYIKDASSLFWWNINQDFPEFTEGVVNAVATLNDYTSWSDEPDRLFVCTQTQGLIIFEQDSMSSYNSANSEFVNTLNCIDVFSGSVAIGSEGKGVYTIRLSHNEWNNYNTANSILDSDNINAVAVGKELGSNASSYYVYYAATETGSVFRKDDQGWSLFFSSPSKVNTLAVNKNNIAIWIGTNDGLYKIKLSGDITHYNKENSPIPSNIITDIEDYYDRGLWIATYHGLVIYKYMNDTN